jgi:carbonic anhydrase
MSNDFCASGKYQSPIDIKSNNTIRCGALCDLTFYYRTSKANIVNVDKRILLDYDTGSYVMYNNEVYELNKISFSVPAAHKLDGFTYPLEINFNHRSPDTGKILIVSVLSEINDATSSSKQFLDMITDALPKKKGKQKHVNTPEEWNCYNLIPEAKPFFAYTGSLPRSPCVEDVQWIVFENTINCSSKFYDKLKPIIKGNIRSIQKRNGRKIFYNPNTGDKNKRNYGDRLRCYTDEQFRKACSCLSGKNDIIDAKNRQALLLIVVVILVTLFVLLILYLIQEDFIGKSLSKMFTTPLYFIKGKSK